jgi:hypothetical protein
MSPEAHKTARTGIYVVGGLMVLTLVGGVIAVVLVANEGKNMMNGPTGAPVQGHGNALLAGPAGYTLTSGDFYVLTYNGWGTSIAPTVAQAQTALDASTSPGAFTVQSVTAGGGSTFTEQGTIVVSAIYNGASGTQLTAQQLAAGWPANPPSQWGPVPNVSLATVEDMGSTVGTGALPRRPMRRAQINPQLSPQ